MENTSEMHKVVGANVRLGISMVHVYVCKTKGISEFIMQ